MKRECLRALLSMTLLALAACGGTEDIDGEGELVDDLEAALLGDNALNPNALNPNALNPNALNPNALSPFALASGISSSSVKAALEDPGTSGDLSRQLLRYVVRCALKDTQSIAFNWTDSNGSVHHETYSGSLGLAQSWMGAPLSNVEDQRWVSACLAALVNYYGITVMVSLRGSHASLSTPTQEELDHYVVKEGAFWGNLFTANPYVRTCHKAGNQEPARTRKRDCAAGHEVKDPDTGVLLGIEECGILEIVGDCEAHCGASSSADYFAGCSEDPAAGAEPQVITTWLQ